MAAYRIVPSPLGPLLLAALADGLCWCDWSDGPLAPDLAALGERFHTEFRHEPHRIADAAEQLAQYFTGRRQTFRLRYVAQGSPFERRIWDAMTTIPYGKRASYGAMAAGAGSPRAVRAAGRACGANPLSIIVPCHRVVGSDGRLTGYGGGLRRKQWLLEHEQRCAATAERAG